MSILYQLKDEIALLQETETYARISETLRTRYREQRGFPEASVKNFCLKVLPKTKKKSVTDNELQNCVAEVSKTGGYTYGRKTMTGLLRASGIKASEKRVRFQMMKTNPCFHKTRVQNRRPVNVIPYIAPYFLEKVHIDQNEKLQVYGLTYVAAIDGF